jgi:uncharacterized protein YbaR (Trm112 family)
VSHLSPSASHALLHMLVCPPCRRCGRPPLRYMTHRALVLRVATKQDSRGAPDCSSATPAILPLGAAGAAAKPPRLFTADVYMLEDLGEALGMPTVLVRVDAVFSTA